MIVSCYFFVFLLAWLHHVDAFQDYSICSKCASNYIVYHWDALHLRRNPQFVDEIDGDGNCHNATYKHTTSKCIGECASFSVIGHRDNRDYTFGVYRDCASSGAFRDLVQQIQDLSTNKLELELKPVKDFERRIVFEVCNESYCNGNSNPGQRYQRPLNLNRNDAQILISSDITLLIMIVSAQLLYLY